MSTDTDEAFCNIVERRPTYTVLRILGAAVKLLPFSHNIIKSVPTNFKKNKDLLTVNYYTLVNEKVFKGL